MSASQGALSLISEEIESETEDKVNIVKMKQNKKRAEGNNTNEERIDKIIVTAGTVAHNNKKKTLRNISWACCPNAPSFPIMVFD